MYKYLFALLVILPVFAQASSVKVTQPWPPNNNIIWPPNN